MRTSEQREVDVVIVGYGPVGATAANFLGAAGLDVVVVERDPSPYPRARAISTDEDTLRCWQHVGLAESLKADMLGGRPIDFVDSRGASFMDWAPKGYANGHPPQMFLYQPALERTIRAGVERFPNVEVLLEHEAGALHQDDEHVTLELTDLRDRSSRALGAKYLLACDGGSSPIRTQLSIGFEGRTYEDPWVVIDTKVKKEWPEVDRLRFHCDPVRPAVDCPTPLGHHRWEFPVLPGEDRDEVSSEPYVWKMLARYGITPEHVEILRRAVYVHHVRFAERWHEGRVFLLGDAAHCMPPWIGQGMASGVRDADNLCWKIAAVVRGQAASPLLDTYEPERQPHVRRTTRAAVFFGRVITERRPLVAAARNHVFRVLMRLPKSGTFLRDGRWAVMPDCRPGFADRRASSSLVGQRLVPQSVVIDHTGHAPRLDDFLAGGFSVILRPSALTRTTASRRSWEALGARTFVIVDRPAQNPGELHDKKGGLIGRLTAHNVDALVLRPDVFVYTAAEAHEPLAGPPLILARPEAAEAQPVRAPAQSPGERALALAAARLGDRGLELAFGHPLALRAIFGEMVKGFVPRVANGFTGEIAYELRRSLGPSSRFTIRVDGSGARVLMGGAAAPALTVRLRAADFLRMAAGQLDQVDLLKARRIDLDGDGLLGARMGAMFGLPPVPDIYVAPVAVDPPPNSIRTLQEA